MNYKGKKIDYWILIKQWEIAFSSLATLKNSNVICSRSFSHVMISDLMY